jgi:hypothetical protein
MKTREQVNAERRAKYADRLPESRLDSTGNCQSAIAIGCSVDLPLDAFPVESYIANGAARGFVVSIGSNVAPYFIDVILVTPAIGREVGKKYTVAAGDCACLCQYEKPGWDTADQFANLIGAGRVDKRHLRNVRRLVRRA